MSNLQQAHKKAVIAKHSINTALANIQEMRNLGYNNLPTNTTNNLIQSAFWLQDEIESLEAEMSFTK